MDGVKRLLPENGEHAGGEGTDKEGTEETRGVSNGDIINVVFRQMSIVEGLVNDGKNGFEVRTGGDLGNYTAICGENVNLRNYDIADDLTIVANNSGGSFVTRTFDGEDFHNIYYSTKWWGWECRERVIREKIGGAGCFLEEI